MSLVYNQQGAEEKENIEGASCITEKLSDCGQELETVRACAIDTVNNSIVASGHQKHGHNEIMTISRGPGEWSSHWQK